MLYNVTTRGITGNSSSEVYVCFPTYTHQKNLTTLDGETVDPGITVKLEMRDVFKIHDAQI